jgi:hypothetical protein
VSVLTRLPRHLFGLEKRRVAAKGINHPKQYEDKHIAPVVPLALSGVNKRLTEP